MKKQTRLRAADCIKMPDGFGYGKVNRGDTVDIYFGGRFDIVIITRHNAKLSGDDLRRINILTTGSENDTN